MAATLLVVRTPGRFVAGDPMSWRPGHIASVRPYRQRLGQREDPARTSAFFVLDVMDREPRDLSELAAGDGDETDFADHLKRWILDVTKLPPQIQRALRAAGRAQVSVQHLRGCVRSPRRSDRWL